MFSTLTAVEQSQGYILRIHGNGEVPVEDVYKFLQALEYSYNSAYVFDVIGQQAEELLRQYAGRPLPLPVRNLLWMGWWPPTPEKVAAMVPLSDRLQLSGVEIHSPGIWDFFGKLNPLEVLRQYLNDRHQRWIDRSVRIPAEEAKLELEIFEKKIQILRDLGATDDDFKLLKEQLLYKSLQELNPYQDRGLILEAEIVDPDREKKKRA